VIFLFLLFFFLFLDTDVAPLWDPELRSFVGLMTTSDYINAIRICQRKSISPTEVTTKTISEILITAPSIFHNNSFQPIDAEDSVLQLCFLLMKTSFDYIPVIDPENGNLISILGPLDVLHLLNYISKLNESLFQQSVESLGIGTFHPHLITATKTMVIKDLLDLMEYHNISSIPIVEETIPGVGGVVGGGGSKIVGLYHRNDVTFIMKAVDHHSMLNNLMNMKVEESLTLREQLLQSGDIMTNSNPLVTCIRSDTIGSIFNSMVMNRSHRIVVIDENSHCLGMISFKDILKYFLENYYQNR
jgi:5'-AMP-activated protein kinase regulatory gamma subunit